MSDARGVLTPVRSPADLVPNPAERTADLHFRGAEEAARRGEYERAAAEYTYSIQLNPNRVEGHYWAAVCMGNYALGLGVMRRVPAVQRSSRKPALMRCHILTCTRHRPR